VINKLLTSKIVEDERIRDIINSDYENSEFVRLMRKITEESINSNEYYQRMANENKFKVDNLSSIDDLASIPYVSAPLFKESAGLYEKFLKIPLISPEFELWNVSSCTSGDPSLVGRSKDDIELLASMTIKCIYDFIPIPRDQWYNTISFDFAPSVTFLNRIAMRYTKVRPIKLYGSILHEISMRMSEPKFLIKFFILKAFKEIIKKRSLVGAFGINTKYVINQVKKNSERPLEKQKYISFGGSLQLINTFMNKIMKENNLKFDLPNSVVNVGGGGWDGHKSQLKYPPIDKTKFISDCIESFGTKSDKITDMYGFTETPITFGSHWSEKHQNFIFHCPSQARIIIRDLTTLDPLTKPGDRGLLEVLTPFGVAASINHAVIVDDLVEIVSKNKCPECGYKGDAFIVHGRIENRKGLGCSSILEWI
jgi:hypothetical protein